MGNYCEILHRRSGAIHRTPKKSSKSNTSPQDTRYSVKGFSIK